MQAIYNKIIKKNKLKEKEQTDVRTCRSCMWFRQVICCGTIRFDRDTTALVCIYVLVCNILRMAHTIVNNNECVVFSSFFFSVLNQVLQAFSVIFMLLRPSICL